MEKNIPIIIPAYRPDDKLIRLLDSLCRADFRHLIVVDDGSGAAYRPIFRHAQEAFNCTVLLHAVNLGKGRALKTAFNHCLNVYPEAIGCITADADGQHSVECITSCAKMLTQHPDGLILGCRNFDDKDVPFNSEWGNKTTRLVMKCLVGVSVSDTQTGLRGISSEFMKELLAIRGERYELETNMLIETKMKGIAIIEVPIQTIYIEDNKSSHYNPFLDSIRVYRMFGRFLFSSFSSAGLDLILFAAFCNVFQLWEWGSHGYIASATAAARVLSALYNYFINYKLVFKSRRPIGITMWKYILLASLQMAFSAFFVAFLYRYIGGQAILIKIPVDIGLSMISFMIQREVVYS